MLAFLRIYPITLRCNHADDLRAIIEKKKASLYIYIEYKILIKPPDFKEPFLPTP
jgi:hypothetical protein